MTDWTDPSTPDLGMKEAFGRDTHLEQSFRRLVADYKIQTVVETGSWRGYTTKKLAEFVPTVYTIESNDSLHHQTEQRIQSYPNAEALLGHSPKVLGWMIPTINHPTLYFLDAHWNDDWPLLDEIKVISELDPGPLVLVIHDVQVPGTDFGYDSYKGQPLTVGYCMTALCKLKFKWRYYFNTKAEGHRRGVLFVVPK